MRSSPGRIALVVVAVAVVVASGLVGLRFATRPAAAPTYSHLVWTHRAVTNAYVNSIAFSPDGTTLAVAGALTQGDEGNNIELWNVPSSRLITRLPCPGGFVTAVAFSPDGRVLAAAGNCTGDHAVQLWDTTTHRMITTLSAGIPDALLGKYAFLTLAFRQDGRILAAGGAAPGQLDGAPIVFWNMSSHHIVGQLATHDPLFNVRGIAFSPDGRTLVSTTTGGDGPANNAVQLWDTTNYRLVGTLSHQEASGVAFSGNTVAVADLGGSVQLWDVPSRQLVRSLIATSASGQGRFAAAAFSPDGRVVAAGDSAGNLTLWDAATGHVISTLSCHCAAHQLGLQSVAFSGNGGYVAAAGNNDGVAVWSAR